MLASDFDSVFALVVSGASVVEIVRAVGWQRRVVERVRWLIFAAAFDREESFRLSCQAERIAARHLFGFVGGRDGST